MLAFSYKSYAGHPGFQRFRELGSIEFFLDYSLASVILGGWIPFWENFLNMNTTNQFLFGWHILSLISPTLQMSKFVLFFIIFFTTLEKKYDVNPFAPGDFAEKRLLKLVEWFSGHCRAIKS